MIETASSAALPVAPGSPFRKRGTIRADYDGSTKAGRQPLLFVSAFFLRRLVFTRLRTVTGRYLGRLCIALSLCMLFAMLLGNVWADNHAMVVDDDGSVYRAVDGEAVNISQHL